VTSQQRILLLSGESDLAPVLRTLVEEQRVQVVQASDARAAQAALQTQSFTCALLDLDSLGDGFQECLSSVRRLHPQLQAVGFASQEPRAAALVGPQPLRRLTWTRENLESVLQARSSATRSADALPWSAADAEATTDHDELPRRVVQLTTLYQIGRAISESRDWTEALDWFLATLRDQLHVRGAAILLYSRGYTVLAPRTVLNVDGRETDACIRALLSSYPTQKPFHDIHPLDCYVGGVLRCTGHGHGWRFTVLPLLHRRAPLGFLVLDKSDWETDSFSRELFFLQTVQTILAEEVANAVSFSTLADLKNFNEAVLERIESGVLTFNLRGETTYANRLARDILQLDEATDGMPPLRYDALFQPTAREPLPSFESLLEREDGRAHCEAALHRDARQVIPVRLRTSRIVNPSDSRPLVLVAFEDLTEQRQLEEQVRRADRLRSLGELSAAIAHEIRNPLQGISLTLSNLQDHIDQDGGQYIRVMFEEIQRLDGIVGSILTFARPPVPEARDFSLHDLALRCVELSRDRAAKREVHLDLRREMQNELCCLDEGQILQVLLNLVRNATDASPAGGTVQIRLRDAPDASGAIERCRIEVIDQGAGIAEESRRKIFDPFFTTKSEGTGLGLSVSLRIIEEHQGHLEVFSRPGEGARFLVDVPRRLQPGITPPREPNTTRGNQTRCV
jgi:signal transduction histidine kinase